MKVRYAIERWGQWPNLLLPTENGVCLEPVSSNTLNKATDNRQAKRKEWLKAILVLVIVYVVLSFMLGSAQLMFRSPQMQMLRIGFGLCIPSLLLTSIVLAHGKGCLQRFCELLLILSVLAASLLGFLAISLDVTQTHHFSRDRHVEASYVENGAFGSSAHSILAKQGWGPFFYRFVAEGAETYPTVGKEINGKVEVRYRHDGKTITRDLDEWLAGKPATSEISSDSDY